jgi:hypothetical protein
MLKKLATVALFGIMSLHAEIYELRTYTAKDGKLENVIERFRNHTARLFERHGMKNIGYWVPADSPASGNTLIYIIAHKNREAAKASWDAFRADPDWIKVKSESEANGAIVDHIVSVFMNPTDFSKLK